MRILNALILILVIIVSSYSQKKDSDQSKIVKPGEKLEVSIVGQNKKYLKTTDTPTISTTAASNITSGGAQLNGSVSPNGSSTIYYFQYGLSTSYGSTTAITNAGSGTSAQNVNSVIAGLLCNLTYHYRVVAYNISGTVNGSDMTFTTGGCAQTISGLITFGGAGLSGVTVTLSGGKDSVAITGSNGNYSFTVNAGGNYTITPSKTNYVFTPVNQTFNNINSNQSQNFTAETLPTAPVLSTPLNNTIDISTNPKLTWVSVNNANSYDIQVSVLSNFGTTVVNSTENINFKSITGLVKNTIYYWKVRALNTAGASPWSDTWSFKTYSEPQAPILSIPSNNSTGISTNVTLIWNAVNLTETYDVQVATSGDFSTESMVFENYHLTNCSQSLQNLKPHFIYYWRTRAENSAGVSLWSSVWSFKTLNNAPGTFLLISPISNTVIPMTQPKKLITFSWNPSTDQDGEKVKYNFSLFGSGYSKELKDLQTTLVSLDIMSDLKQATQYQWYVEATDGIDTTKSNIEVFKTSETITSIGSKKIQSFALEQNYPNPFNPETRITYSIPENSLIVLKIFDTFGREIETLVNRVQSAGDYQVTWQPKELSSGIYYYRITAGDYSQVRKMLLLK